MNQIVGRNTIAGETLRGFVERVEAEEAGKKAHADNIKVIMAEANSLGFLPKGIRYVIKKRKMKPSERQEDDDLKHMYMHAMGMEADNPLFRTVGLMGVDILSRESVVNAMKQFVPSEGSIEVEAGGKRVRLTRNKVGEVSVTEVVEKAMDPSRSDGGAIEPKPEIPECSSARAEEIGREAYRADTAIILNPFPYGHPNRPHWDLGWRKESGGDGMDD
jgi:uncharacterized protein (UPF0335 family)